MSNLLKSFYHNLKEPVIICDLKNNEFYQNKAAKFVFKKDIEKKGLCELKKIGYKFYFDFCLLNSEDITKSPFDEAVNSSSLYSTYGIYQETERKFLYFVIKAFSIKRYRILYFYDVTKDLECEKVYEENEKLRLENKKFANTNSKAQNQAFKMALLNRISSAISKTLDINTLINTLLKELIAIMGANKAYFAKRINEENFEIEFSSPDNILPENKIFSYNKKIIDSLNKENIHSGCFLKEHDGTKIPLLTPQLRIIMPIKIHKDLSFIIILYLPKKKITEIETELLNSISIQISNAFLSATLFNKVTKQKEELQKTINELKETQLQLINSEKMASLGQLIASVAHEINTPLASISANNEILKKILKGNINADIEDIFLDVNSVDREAIKRITNLVHSLKRFVRLDETSLQEADINKEIDLTLEILRHKTKKGIEIIKQYSKLPIVKCYPNMLNQVFLNVLMNAIQSIEKEKLLQNENYKPQIEILTSAKENNLIVEIKDNGGGIKESDKKKIFQAGFTTKKIGEGTGLGLAICKKIIEKHKGEIKFTSCLKNNEKLTTFKITIPIVK